MATDTKVRLLTTSTQLFQRQGLTGTGIKQILAEAGAPFSSLYHHFPGGKDDLAAQAIRTSGNSYQQLVEAVWDAQGGVLQGAQAIFDVAATVLEESDFAEGCPIATVALEVASTNEPLRVATAEVFEQWVEAATSRLTDAGIPLPKARSVALAIIALLEGAFILCQATKSTDPMLACGALAVAAVRDAM